MRLGKERGMEETGMVKLKTMKREGITEAELFLTSSFLFRLAFCTVTYTNLVHKFFFGLGREAEGALHVLFFYLSRTKFYCTLE